MCIKKALTIAGSDSGGGAGIQADIKTFQELDVYGMSALTAVTAQNTLGVHGVYPMDVEAVAQQIIAVAEDLTPDAVKTGMLFSDGIIQRVAALAEQFNWHNLVIDPVMVAKGGARLLQEEAVVAMRECLLPLATVVTPNIPEAEVLAQMNIKHFEDRKEAAVKLHNMGAKYVVVKGGHDMHSEELIDLVYDGEHFTELRGKRIDTRNTHGTGCTFSAAMTAELAKGCQPMDAIATAHAFIHAAVAGDLGLGRGHGPTNHWAYRKQKGRMLR